MTTATRGFPLLVAFAACAACAGVVAAAGLVRDSGAVQAAPRAVVGARPAAATPTCPQAPAGASLAEARQVANLFIDHAVLRRRPECAYALVVANLRRGSTRAEWARGRVPLDAYRSTSANVARSSAVRVSLPKELGMWVFLEAPDLGRRAFELVLVARGGRWLVDYWGTTLDPAAPAFPAPAPGTS